MAHPLTGDIPLENYVHADYTLTQVLHGIPFPPQGSHISVNPNIINKDNLNLQSAITAPQLDELHASLPHWSIPARPDDGNQIPWWVVYPYHPVIDTFGTGRTNVSVPHCFLDTAEVDNEARPEIFTNLPDDLQTEWGNLLINTRFRFVLYHTKKPVRLKAAKHFGERLNNSTPYFNALRARDRHTPTPTTPQHIVAQCQTHLTKCREVFLGRRRPYNSQHFHPFVTSFGLEALTFVGPGALPVTPLPQDPTSPPTEPPHSTPVVDMGTPTPPLPVPESAAASSLPATTYSSPATGFPPASLPTPSAPVPPITSTTPKSSAPPPPATPATPTAMEVETVSAPPAIRMTPPQGTPPLPPRATASPLMSPRPAAAHDAMDVETTTVLSSTPHDTIQHQPIDDDTKRMTIAPLVIPSRSPKPSSLPTTTSAEQPTLLTCYAGLFARLPSLGQILNSQYAHAQELYNHLFAPSTPVADPDTPNPAFHHSAPPRDASIPITSPFSDLVDAFVDIPSSLADVHNMSRPTAPPLTLSNPPTQQPTSQFNFAPLLQFLTSTINPHLTHLVSQPTHSCFIIDLPFLVVSPEYIAGATFSPASLRTLLSPSASMVVFSSSSSIIVPDVLLHLPPHVKIQGDAPMPDATDPQAHLPNNFRIRPAEELQALIAATTTLHLSSHATRRADLIDPVQVDLHFPLSCTPYYGYIPDDMADMHIELFQLTCHLLRSTPLLLDVWDGTTLPTPSTLLATLAALHPERITTVPGEGIFIRPYLDPDSDNPPQSCWLNQAPGPNPFVPLHFFHLESTLTAHTSDSPLPMFSSAIPLGPAACVYLNPGLLPPPHLNPPGALAIIGDADPHRGGWGAIQYYYHFRTDSGSIPLLDLKPDAHSLPLHFHEDLLTFEHWPPSETLLTFDDPVPPEPIPILTISCPESQTIASPDHGITFCNGPARTSRAFSHGPTLANADWRRKTSDISGYWQGDHCHTLGVGCLAEAFYLTAHLWPELSIETVTSDQFTLPVTSAFASHTSHAQECVHSWRLPPHSLFHSTITLLFKLFPSSELLLEGFGSGAYSAAVLANRAFASRKYSAILTAIGGIAMHLPTFSTLITNFKEAHFHYEEEFAAHYRVTLETTSARPIAPPPSPKYVLIMTQHLHDRASPWNLNLVLLAHLFNHGIHVITLHDNLAPQQERASAQGTDFKPSSKFGRYRHDYEWLIPSLKFFSPSTLLSRSLRPLHYHELESWEGAISSQYSSDLQDLLFAFLSLWGAPPLPTFAATPEALGFTLIHGVHRWPDKVESYFHLDRAPHDTPLTYYTRVFLHQLRFPALRALGLPEADVLAIEHSTRSALLNLPLLQALDFLHTQLLAGLCVAAPQRGLIKRDHLHDPTRRHPPPTSGDSPLQKKRSNTSSLQSSAVGLVNASRQICLLSLSNATPLRGQTVIPKATTETMSLASRQATYYN